jgi:hypothetical protein
MSRAEPLSALTAELLARGSFPPLAFRRLMGSRSGPAGTGGQNDRFTMSRALTHDAAPRANALDAGMGPSGVLAEEDPVALTANDGEGTLRALRPV